MQRGEGKTAYLIKKSAESGNYIVCRTMEVANHIQYHAKEMGLDIPLPITYSEFIHKEYGYVNGFLIDDLEIFLEHLSSVPVNAITMLP